MSDCHLKTLGTATCSIAHACPTASGLPKWLSRDPINEPGFKLLTTGDEDFYSDEEKNLYGFVANRPIDNYDINGLFDPGTTCRTLTIVAPTVAVGIAALPVEAIILGTVIVAEAVVITYDLCSKPCQKRCKACVPEVGKQAIKRTDLKGKPHGGIPTPHSHIVQVNQSSYPECKCFWNNANPDTVPGIPNLKPLSQYPSPPSGGGPAN